MIHHLTWAAYLKVMAGILVIYYGYVFLKYFSGDLKKSKRSSRLASGSPSSPFAFSDTAASSQNIDQSGSPDSAEALIEEADEFISSIRNCIRNSCGKPVNADALQAELKSLFRKSGALSESPHRPAINELVVAECQKTGIALLSEEVVDKWWSD